MARNQKKSTISSVIIKEIDVQETRNLITTIPVANLKRTGVALEADGKGKKSCYSSTEVEEASPNWPHTH